MGDFSLSGLMGYLKAVFLFDAHSPMIFTKFNFWGFFLISYAIYAVVYKKIALRNAYLFLISAFFYYKTSGIFVFLLITTAFIDFNLAKVIFRSTSTTLKKWLIVASVVLNLFVLFYFKYAYFFVDSLNQVSHAHHEVFNWFAYCLNTIFQEPVNDLFKFFAFPLWNGFTMDKIILPVGISFYTFQTISYVVDVYRKRIEPVKSFLDFGFFVSFFPQLVAGPIVRANEFVPQIYQPFSLSKRMFGLAVFLILNGLIKKMILGDYIAVNFIDRIFDNPMYYTGFESVMALIAYSLQVYCDFSGYTDIAIGVAILMGFHLPTNFNSPYKAQSVAEFWKRWHISLSTWLKDYLYIPLGGNRTASWATWICISLILTVIVFLSGNLWLFLVFGSLGAICFILAWVFPAFKKTLTTDINLMITMLFGGLWHGASWNFVIWGGLNGLGLVFYKNWKKISPFKNNKGILVRIYAIAATFAFITFTRIYFRAKDMDTVAKMWDRICHNFRLDLAWDIILGYKYVFLAMLVGFIIHWLPSKTKSWYRAMFIQLPVYAKVAFAVITVFVIVQFISSDLQPFIYFQF
jgi:D-alanyl-lipoteichoic acid acyltransferase DltB (MBOAT superfamily)